MQYADIRHCLANCRFTEHARREMDTEPLGPIVVDEVLRALATGEIIEDYPSDEPYPSCLVLGWTDERRPLHVVCATVPPERRLIVITTYRPDPNRWDAEFRRRSVP